MSKKIKIMGATIALLAVCICGSAFAWLTDYEYSNEGHFSIGKVDLLLTGAETDGVLCPGGDLDINPEVTIASDSEAAYVFVQVTLPKVTSGQTIEWDDDAAGGDGGYETTEIEESTDVANLTVDSDWICIDDATEESSADVFSKLYAHKAVVEPGESTGELYSSAKVLNFDYEASNEDSTAPTFADADIEVTAYAISADGYSYGDNPTVANYNEIYSDAVGQHESFK